MTSMTAAEVIRTRAPIAPADVAVILDHVAGELSTEWGLRNRLHGAVQPNNIVVTFRSGRVGAARLIGFADPELAGTTLMTAEATAPSIRYPHLWDRVYPAPETAYGALHSHCSDTYSLACTAFELLTGARPFTGSSVTEMIGSVLSGTIPELHGVAPGPSAVVRTAMSPDPAARPRTTILFAADFRRSLRI